MTPRFFDAGLRILGRGSKSFRDAGCTCRFVVSDIKILNNGIFVGSSRANRNVLLISNAINCVHSISIERSVRHAVRKPFQRPPWILSDMRRVMAPRFFGAGKEIPGMISRSLRVDC